MTPYYQLQDEADDTLIFESRFEHGNLGKAFRVGLIEYNLYLSPDSKTEKMQQWYYFRLQNVRKGVMYKFNINNLANAAGQYKHGLKPLIYSVKQAGRDPLFGSEHLASTLGTGYGWYRDGDNIQYFTNHLRKPEGQEHYSTLSFEVAFPYDDDTIYVAYNYPYTYTDLMGFIKTIATYENGMIVR